MLFVDEILTVSRVWRERRGIYHRPHDVDSSLDLWVVMQRWQDSLVNFSEKHTQKLSLFCVIKSTAWWGSLPRALSSLDTFTTPYILFKDKSICLLITASEWNKSAVAWSPATLLQAVDKTGLLQDQKFVLPWKEHGGQRRCEEIRV